MLQALKPWLVVVLALALAFPIADWAENGFEAFNGQVGVPLVVSDSVADATTHFLGATAAFGLIALVAGWLTQRYTGMLVYGLCWIVVAMRGAPIDDVRRLIGEMGRGFPSTFAFFAVETLLWNTPALILLLLLIRLAPNRYPEQDSRFSPASVRGFVLTLGLTLVLGWIFLRTDLQGQTVCGFAAACALATMIARLVWPHCNASVLFAAPAIVGVVGQLGAAVLIGDDALIRAARAAAGDDPAYWALGRLLPLHAIAGGTFGVALGIGLARVFGTEDLPANHPNGVPAATR